MDRLWAPWRSKYIKKCLASKRHTGCIFCIGESGKNDRKRYVLTRSRHSFSILNAYPYNNAHVMVAPYRHIKDMDMLSGDEFLDMMRVLTETKKALDKHLKPQGYNIGINLGKVAGAGFDGHIHMHIVPRWVGDTNFMSTISDSRVVSSSLEATYKLLKK